MASGADHYTAAEQALAVAVASDSAMALRAADVHASLAVAAAYVAAGVQNKGVTNLTADMQAFVTALAKPSTSIAAIKVLLDDAGKALGIAPA